MLDNIDVEYFLRVHSSDTIGNIGATDISVSCPLCREGKSWKYKHRLHLYTKDSYDIPAVHCWNCDYSSNLYGYLKEYYPSDFESYSKARRGESFKELKIHKNKDIELPIIKPIKIEEPKPNLVVAPKSLIKPPKEVDDYINNRGLEVQSNWLYSTKDNYIKFNDIDILLSEYIIIPFTFNDKWYGFQALSWKEKKFFIYLVDNNTSWKVENWDNIDKDKEVYIFESVYDRLSSGIENSISCMGSNLHTDRLKQLKKPIFCLDNQNVDEKSAIQTLKYLEEGYKCFIWSKGSDSFKDTNDLRKIGISYTKIEHMIKSNIYKGIQGIVRLKLI